MNRRAFLRKAAGSAVLATGTAAVEAAKPEGNGSSPPLKLKYALRYGWFKDLPSWQEQLERMRAEGFRAIENNRFKRMDRATMEPYGRKLEELGVEHGVFIANRSPNGGAGLVDPKEREAFIEEIKTTVELAPIINARFVTVLTGNEITRMPRGIMRANIIEGLKRAGDLLGKAGITGVVEPLNTKRDHPGYFLNRSDEAYAIMKAVDNPHIKILFDIYHQQITEGNLIASIRRCWDEIGYFQFADVPGRKEPWTGEINYRNVFRMIYHLQNQAGRDMFIGAELGPSKGGNTEGTMAVIEAVRKADDFLDKGD